MWSLLQCLVNVLTVAGPCGARIGSSLSPPWPAPTLQWPLPAEGSTCCSAIDRHRTVAEAQTPFLVTVARYFLVDVAVLVCASARRQVAGLAKNADARHKGIAWAADGIWRDVSEKAVFRRIG